MLTKRWLQRGRGGRRSYRLAPCLWEAGSRLEPRLWEAGSRLVPRLWEAGSQPAPCLLGTGSRPGRDAVRLTTVAEASAVVPVRGCPSSARYHRLHHRLRGARTALASAHALPAHRACAAHRPIGFRAPPSGCSVPLANRLHGFPPRPRHGRNTASKCRASLPQCDSYISFCLRSYEKNCK